MAQAPTFNSERRLWLVTIGSILLIVLLGVKLFDLQVLKNSYYRAVAENQRQRASELIPHRGIVYMKEGKSDIFPAATNQRTWYAYAVPRNMDDSNKVVDELAPAILAFRERQYNLVSDILFNTGQPSRDENINNKQDALDILKNQLRKKFDKKADPYETFLKPYEVIDDELRTFLEEKKLSGIVLMEQETRTYPENSLAAHILGYVGYQAEGRIGRYGIEGFFQDKLAGKSGFLTAEKDATGKMINIGAKQFTPAQDGEDIVLTVDRVVQSYVEDELKKGVKQYGAERGSILVMNPRTGEILGMATYPTFNPNYYYAINNPRVQLNPVVSDIFEPGSILKPLVMAAAIEEGLVKPETTMVDNGPVKVAEYTINTFDNKHHGVQTMTQILEQSNNIGMVWVGQKLGAEKMYDYFRRFGLGEKTGIELEGETQSTLASPDKWDITTIATSSFGQGVALTPLQALDGINVIANRGQLMQPHIVSRYQKNDNQDIQNVENKAVRRVISPDTAEKLGAMMVSVIENGVAGLAKVPGYYLAGKTGTAQVPDEHGKYDASKKIISFVGFGPVEKPRFSILIKLDNPSGLSFASGTAAPMFRNLSEKLLQYYQIPPSYSVDK